MSDYDESALRAAAQAIATGHRDTQNLRELLIWTTCKTTSVMVEQYFQLHHSDEDLLRTLLGIAAEGLDAGDAPWAAANAIADFPVSMLRRYRAELLELSKHEWMYLSQPALRALARVETEGT